jgi:hypothetical protein
MMNKKDAGNQQKQVGFSVEKTYGRRRNVARVSFSTMLPADYTPQERGVLKQFESDVLKHREKINTEK